MPLTRKDRIIGCIMGMAAGDAVGVPVEFRSRGELKTHPVRGMRAFGTHNQPAGTWSDDTSLGLCSLASLLEKESFNPIDMMGKFRQWYSSGYMTARGEVFDIGGTTSQAIQRARRGTAMGGWAATDVNSNGNGSLMRLAPVSCYAACFSDETHRFMAHNASVVTHGHEYSTASCVFFSYFLQSILDGNDVGFAQTRASVLTYPHLSDATKGELKRVTDGSILTAKRDDVRGSGYVVHCLEASMWAVANTRSFPSAVLRAVNLGEDTDTTACVTGAIAGAMYGMYAIPAVWRKYLARHDDVLEMAQQLADLCERTTENKKRMDG